MISRHSLGFTTLFLIFLVAVASGIAVWSESRHISHLSAMTVQVSILERLTSVSQAPLATLQTLISGDGLHRLLEPVRQMRLDLEASWTNQVLGAGMAGMAWALALGAILAQVLRHRRSHSGPLATLLGLAGVLLALASIAFIAGLMAPSLAVATMHDTDWMGRMLFSLQSKSVIETVQHLASSGQMPLAVLVALCAVLLPGIKLAAVAIVMMRPEDASLRPVARIVRALGRWSFADVFVVAILLSVLALRGDGWTDAWPLLGLWFYLVHCIFASLACACLPHHE